MSTSTTSVTEDRALSLLGSGLGPETVATALGISISRISQLLSSDEFAAKVAELRFKNLSAHNERDSKYDSIEDELIEKMQNLLPLMMRPMEVLRAIQVINTAKRRGQAAPEQITNQQTVVNLVLPSVLVNKFTTNIHNQIVSAGAQDLVTMQAGTLLNTLKSTKGVPNGHVISSERNTETALARTE